MSLGFSTNGKGFAQQILQRMEKDLLIGTGFEDRNALILSESRLPPTGIDSWIAPHRMSQQEKEMNSTGLSSIVFGQPKTELLKSFRQFDKGMLLTCCQQFLSCKFS